MRIAVLSDIHGNQHAFFSVLKSIKKQKIDTLFILGDLVGYYYGSHQILKELSNWNTEIIRGNHEVLLNLCQEGNENDRETLKTKYGSGFEVALKTLSAAQLEFLKKLPEKKAVTIDGISIELHHGSPLDPNEYTYPTTPLKTLMSFDKKGTDFIFIGHTHYPFCFHGKYTTIINAGSVGQARSVGGIANWAVLDTSNKVIAPQNTPYDIHPLINEINQHDPGLPYLSEVLLRNNCDEKV